LTSRHTEIAEILVERGADVTIRDNFNGRSPLEVAKYRQFQDIVSLLSAAERRHAATGASDGAGRVDVKKVRRKKNKKQEGGLVAGTGGGEDEASYARPQSQIDKEGNRPVFGGVHFKHMDLFLGRYRLPDDAPGTIEAFRKSSKREGTSLAHHHLTCAIAGQAPHESCTVVQTLCIRRWTRC
jgi:hypothetical protein